MAQSIHKHNQPNSIKLKLILLSVLWTIFVLISYKQVNLNKYIATNSNWLTNSYLNSSISGWDCWLILVLVLAGLEKLIRYKKSVSVNQNRNKIWAFMNYKYSFKSLILVLTILFLLLHLIISPQLAFGLMIVRIILWLVILPHLPKNLKIVLLLYSFFDHFLISSSLPVVIISWLFIFTKKPLSYQLQQNPIVSKLWRPVGLLLLISSLNWITATWQVFLGWSLGIWSEPVLDVNIISGIARQGSLLRGYGLSQHPNILGFSAVIVLIYLYSYLKSNYPNNFGNLNNINRLWSHKSDLNLEQTLIFGLVILNFMNLILSFSRLSWFVLIVFWLLQIKSNSIFGNWWVLKVVSVFGFVIGWFSTFRKDIYRINDLTLWLDSWNKLDIGAKVMGSGYYPQLLQTNYPNLESWQWQPVHNVWLNLVFSFGLFGLSLMIFLLTKK